MIEFLAADRGDLVLSTKVVGGVEYRCRTPAQVAAAIAAAGGVSDQLMHSSSYDFAHEYGFRSSAGARTRWERGLELYAKRINKGK